MAEIQSTDGSLYSRESDVDTAEEFEDLIPPIVGNTVVGKSTDDNDKLNNNEQLETPAISTGNVDSAKESLASKRIANLKKKEKKKSHHRKSLDDVTLLALEGFLKSENCFSDSLEYEEVSAFCSKVHRYAVERTRGRQGMLFRDGNIQNGDDPSVKVQPIQLTEDDIAQERLYHTIYQREEFYAVATKFLKHSIDGAHETGGPAFFLHTKTANWLKRAAGLQRSYDPYEKNDPHVHPRHRTPAHSEDSDEGDWNAEWAVASAAAAGMDRRMTRRRVQMTRKKRRLERQAKDTENFRLLSQVTLELSQQKQKQTTTSARTSTGRTKKGLKRSSTSSWFPTTLGGETTDEDDDVRIATEIGGRNGVAGDTFPSLEPTGLESIDTPYFCRDNDQIRVWDGDKSESQTMEGCILPPVVARLGLEFRPRPPGLEDATGSFPVEPRGTANDGDSNGRITNRTRMRNSKRLTNALSNKRARRWAMHEFFYSDLDKEWYQKDGFVSDLAKLGFPIDARTRLTREEWFLVRRKLRKRPRRFSKRFIAEQLQRRNRHRALMRSLQKDPSETEFAPIPAGTPVTAYDQRRQTIRRGRILMHDPKKHCYLVQFNDKDSGCEVCPDFEVAVSLPITTARGKTATPPPLYEPHPEFSSSNLKNEDIAELVIPNGIANGERTEDMERELLISSIAFAAEAFERKKAILEALESCTDNLGEGTSKHCSRLLWNLDRVNTTLKAALAYLQVLYGRVYGSSASNEAASESKIEPMKLSTPIPNSKEFEEMVTSLVSVSNKIGDLALSSGCKDTTKSSSSSSELLRDHVSGSTSLLLLANYLAETSSSLAASGLEETTYSSAMDTALKTLLDRYSTHCLPPTKENRLVGKRLERDSRVEEELKDLGVAIGMLRTETALATDETRTFELRNAMG